MKNFRFEARWPEDDLAIECYANEISNFHYHWHTDDYEVSVLLNGCLEFCNDSEQDLLEGGDVSLINPGLGHTTFARAPNTCGLTFHFSASAFRRYVEKGFTYHFSGCHSTAKTRNEERYRFIRMYAAQIYEALSTDAPFAQLTAKAATQMLLSTLCRYFNPRPVATMLELKDEQKIIRNLVTYIEKHYAEKITLEALANYSQYNRTYISTLFKNAMGINFYSFLTRVRFQQALLDMTSTDKTLTEIALSNGFTDLKGFRKQFQEAFGLTPAEYRSRLSFGHNFSNRGQWHYISNTDEIVQQRLQQFLHLQPVL